MQRIALSWSSGKDSAWTLHVLRQNPEIQIVALITTFNEQFDRVAMHAVRRSLVEQQAAAAGIPLWPVPLPWPCPNEEYERRMRAVCDRARNEGVEAVAFGDLFLAEVREYREKQLAPTGLHSLFPLWHRDTALLAEKMMDAGLQAKITCVDPKVLDPSFAGRDWNRAFLRDLPEGVDPCGENGEFHSFVYAGPMFERAIPVCAGETVERDGFVFSDLV